ncbi:LZTR1 [Symbiodinium sp. CCMP2592]|nr:LZTR1 [Symbiodinium sp. CCMP2592]
MQLRSTANASLLGLLGSHGTPEGLEQMKASIRSMAASRLNGSASPFNMSQSSVVPLLEAIQENMNVLIEDIRASAQSDRDDLELAGQAFGQCNTDLANRPPITVTTLPPTVIAAGDAHDTCRDEEANKKQARDDALAAFRVGMQNLQASRTGALVDCLGKLAETPIPYIEPLDGDEALDCANPVQQWLFDFSEDVTDKNAAYKDAEAAYAPQKSECDERQHFLESRFCTFRGQLMVSCAALNQCFTDAQNSLTALWTIVQQSIARRLVAFKSASQVKCYINILQQDTLTEAALNDCDTNQPDSTTLTVTQPAPASQETCDTTLVDEHPCTPSWINTYYTSKDWHGNVEQELQVQDGSTSPIALDAFAFAAHDSEPKAFLYGGRDTYPTYHTAMWTLTLDAATSSVQWTSSSVTAGGPGDKWGSTAVWTGESVLVFGGRQGASEDISNHLYEFIPGSPDTWSEVPPASSGLKRWLHTAVWKPDTKTMLVFGGSSTTSDGDVSNSVSKYTWRGLASGSWLDGVVPGTAPAARQGHGAVWAGGTLSKMLIFGGRGAGIMNDLWAFSPTDDSWEELIPSDAAGSPPTRYAMSAVWADSLNAMVVFGGQSNGAPVNDLWQYTTAAGWEMLIADPKPSQRRLAGAVWAMVIFGGTHVSVRLGDAWQLQL